MLCGVFTMLTRQDTKQIIRAVKELEWWEILHNPEDVAFDRWDYHHYHNLRQFAEKGNWHCFVAYLRTCGETHVRDSVETLIKWYSPRWYHQFLEQHDSNAE